MIIKFFNGKYYSTKILLNIRNEIYFYDKFFKQSLCLSILLIGNNFSTNLYVKNKINACNFTNINVFLLKFSNSVKLITLIKIIFILNNDLNITGIIIQFPLISKLNKISLFSSIDHLKDIDLLNPLNFGKYVANYSTLLIPSTAAAIIFFLEKIKINTIGLKSVVFGFSNIVGKPIIFELMRLGITVSIINKVDKDFLYLTNSSDIIISAVGLPNFFSYDFMSKGGIVIDIGINEYDYNMSSGDIDLREIYDTVNFITPVPGGIGPLTVAFLLSNMIKIHVNKKFKIML